MDIVALAKTFILKYGVLGVFCTSTLEYLCIPIPSEIVLPFVGAISKSNNQNILWFILASVLGGTLGSLIMFLFGKYIVQKFILRIEYKFPKIKNSIENLKNFLLKYRYLGVFLSRTLPIARTFTSIIAGVIGMKLSKFLFFSSLGMTLWDYILIKFGTVITTNAALLLNIFKKNFFIVILVFIIIIIIMFLIIRYLKKTLL